MKNEIKNVQLSFCCQKDWNAFKSIDERTRFCGSCQHQVIDFTEATQSELDQAVNSGKRICGRFKQAQMKESFLKIAAASLIAVASSSCNEEISKSPEPLQINYEKPCVSITMGVLLPPSHMNDSSRLRIIPKIILDTAKARR